MINKVAAGTKCDHCGDFCETVIENGDKVYCCYGCSAVSDFLSENQLNKFYLETSLKNKSWSEIRAEKKYGFLNNKKIQDQLLQFKGDRVHVIQLDLPNIHCSSCIFLLENLNAVKRGVIRSEVNFTKKIATITYDPAELDLKEISILLAQIGYPPDISLAHLDKTQQVIKKDNIGSKIAVAGFCFGNAMLISMPEYLDTKGLLTSDFQTLFGWINLGLAFPILLFSGRDYFISAWKGLKLRHLNIDVPIALGILTLFSRSAFEILSNTGPGYVDSLAGLVFFLLLGKWFQNKSYQALAFDRDFSSYFPISVTTLINGIEYSRPLKELRRGDIVVIHNNELIPADGIIEKGIGHIDYSFVTGESATDEKREAQKVFAGGRQKGGELIVKLDRSVSQSELVKLWQNDAFNEREHRLSTRIDLISKYFTAAVIMIALAAGIYWTMVDSRIVWDSVSAVLIVACPCALALTLPFAYGHSMRLLGRNGLYLKNANVTESLSKVESIVFDKTGTLTSSSNRLQYVGQQLTNTHRRILFTVMANSSHPLAKIIKKSLTGAGKKLEIDSFREDVGQGVSAQIADNAVKIGSAEYLGVVNPEDEHDFSYIHIYINEYLGCYKIQSEYRKGIFHMLKRLKPKFSLRLLSGDNDADRNILEPYFNSSLFNQKPKDKLTLLSNSQENTLMVGDGLNDAGALKQASVGLAVSDDIQKFSPGCDAILSSGSINQIPDFLTFTRMVTIVVFVAFGLSFMYNFTGVYFAVTGQLTPLVSAILMPLSSVTVVSFTILMVNWLGKKFLNNKPNILEIR